MKMEYWETRPYKISLKPGVDSRLADVRGIVVHNAIGVHMDPESRSLCLTDMGSGKRFQNTYFDLLVAIEEAQRLAIEGWPDHEVE
jgi:hypothetical protein